MLRVGGDGEKRLGRRLEQKSIDRCFVLEGDSADRRRQGENDMVIGDRQQLSLARREPIGRRSPLALRAMAVAAGVVGEAGMGAVLASLDMAAERRGTAGLNGRHNAELRRAHMPGTRRTPRLAVAAEDIRHLQHRTRHWAQPGGDAPSFRCSSGLWTLRIVLMATRA